MPKKEMHPNSLANLTPWKPGQPGNPKGKRGKISFLPILDKILNKEYERNEIIEGKMQKSKRLAAEWMMIELVQNALDGKEKSIAMVMERIDGAVQRNIKLETDDSTQINILKNKIRKNLGKTEQQEGQEENEENASDES